MFAYTLRVLRTSHLHQAKSPELLGLSRRLEHPSISCRSCDGAMDLGAERDLQCISWAPRENRAENLGQTPVFGNHHSRLTAKHSSCGQKLAQSVADLGSYPNSTRCCQSWRTASPRIRLFTPIPRAIDCSLSTRHRCRVSCTNRLITLIHQALKAIELVTAAWLSRLYWSKSRVLAKSQVSTWVDGCPWCDT